MNLRWTWTPFDGLTREDLYAVLQLRQAVFIVEQACAYADADGLDPAAHHLCGWAPDGRLLAYLRAFAPGRRGPEASLGRVLSALDHRGTGIGRAVVAEGLARMAHTFGPTAIRIAAQARLEPFYQGFGFVTAGPAFLEDGIPHLPMVRPAPPFGTSEAVFR